MADLAADARSLADALQGLEIDVSIEESPDLDLTEAVLARLNIGDEDQNDASEESARGPRTGDGLVACRMRSNAPSPEPNADHVLSPAGQLKDRLWFWWLKVSRRLSNLVSNGEQESKPLEREALEKLHLWLRHSMMPTLEEVTSLTLEVYAQGNHQFDFNVIRLAYVAAIDADERDALERAEPEWLKEFRKTHVVITTWRS